MSKTPLSLYSSYYIDNKVDSAAVTNYGGIFPYLDLMLLTGLPGLASECLSEKSLRAWQHAEHICALLALNLTGGDCVDDLVKLADDPGIGMYMCQIGKAVGVKNRKFTRGGDSSVPSLTSVREWLDEFHNAEEDSKRGYGKAFIPEPNESLSGLRKANREFVKRGWNLYERSGRDNPNPVKFAIGYIKTKDFRKALNKLDKAQWEPVFDKKGRLDYEVAEVPFVSNTEALIKAEPYRHIAIRRKSKQGILPGLGTNDGKLADEETMEMDGTAYHVHAIISNIWDEDWSLQRIVEWYNDRCGGGEAIHSILKSDLAGGSLPSNKFGVNAAWWSVAVLAHNLHALLEKLAMPKGLIGSRFKRLRYHLINVSARVVTHARQCVVRYFQTSVLHLINQIRGELAGLATALG